ncbi:hypothetical protein ACIRS1_37280 [Kitasatospora sp. NPDC101176]|uniref:hypothetical protein n=1 Tax=Kitasatospora sp. NPDC101176 TaxID=3364099 RepID=UPI00381EF571
MTGIHQAGACRSVLTRADLLPLAGHVHGRIVEQYQSDDDHTKLHPAREAHQCDVGQQTAEDLVWIQVLSIDQAVMTDTLGPDASRRRDGPSRLDFGADVQGWVWPGRVSLGFRCDNPDSARMGQPYVAITVRAGELTDPASEKVGRAVLGIALKYAKHVVAGYPCTNAVRLPDGVPATMGSPSDPGR